MYDLLVLRPGGGWATDTTGSATTCARRRVWLSHSTRGRRQIVRVIERATGRELR